MRSSILRRRGGRVADDLRIYRRQGVAPPPPPPPPDVESDSESEDEGDELDGPDTPSPTQTTFPSGISTTTSLASTQTSTVDLGNIGTETLGITSTATPTPTTNGAAFSATSETSGPRNSQGQQSNLSQSTEQPALMTQGGVVAMGVLIGLATVATIIFAIWKCRRRRNRTKSGASSKFKPFFLRRDNSQQPEVRAPAPTQASRTHVRNQSRTMDELMAAAYAVENGQAWAGRPASQQSSESLWREKQAFNGAHAPQQRQKSTSGSLYANQLLTGFWKKGGDDMPAAPGQARVPAPAPSVAGKTEMTSQSAATESTWNTWGVTQHHSKPKANWTEKFRR